MRRLRKQGNSSQILVYHPAGALQSNLFSSHEVNLIGAVEQKYAQLHEKDDAIATKFDKLKYVEYSTFMSLGRLPRFSDVGVLKEYRAETGTHDLALVFMSYRWIGLGGPDDLSNTQYDRMCDALEKLRAKEGIPKTQVGIWLVGSPWAG